MKQFGRYLAGLVVAAGLCSVLVFAQGPGGVNARDRIGTGPWVNAAGRVVAANLDELATRPSARDRATGSTKPIR